MSILLRNYKWQKLKLLTYAANVDLNHQNGMANAQVAENGIH